MHMILWFYDFSGFFKWLSDEVEPATFAIDRKYLEITA